MALNEQVLNRRSEPLHNKPEQEVGDKISMSSEQLAAQPADGRGAKNENKPRDQLSCEPDSKSDAASQSSSAGSQKPSYKHIPHSQKPPHLVAKRNARERRRVQAVNQAFYNLRRKLPIQNRNKRVSKVKTLLNAIDYIRKMKLFLAQDAAGKQPASSGGTGAQPPVPPLAELLLEASGESQRHQQQQQQLARGRRPNRKNQAPSLAPATEPAWPAGELTQCHYTGGQPFESAAAPAEQHPGELCPSAVPSYLDQSYGGSYAAHQTQVIDSTSSPACGDFLAAAPSNHHSHHYQQHNQQQHNHFDSYSSPSYAQPAHYAHHQQQPDTSFDYLANSSVWHSAADLNLTSSSSGSSNVAAAASISLTRAQPSTAASCSVTPNSSAANSSAASSVLPDSSTASPPAQARKQQQVAAASSSNNSSSGRAEQRKKIAVCHRGAAEVGPPFARPTHEQPAKQQQQRQVNSANYDYRSPPGQLLGEHQPRQLVGDYASSSRASHQQQQHFEPLHFQQAGYESLASSMSDGGHQQQLGLMGSPTAASPISSSAAIYCEAQFAHELAHVAQYADGLRGL